MRWFVFLWFVLLIAGCSSVGASHDVSSTLSCDRNGDQEQRKACRG